jgi:hypothetical protein
MSVLSRLLQERIDNRYRGHPAKPLVVAGTSGARTPALIVAILSAAGLALSLIGRRYAEREAPHRHAAAPSINVP